MLDCITYFTQSLIFFKKNIDLLCWGRGGEDDGHQNVKEDNKYDLITVKKTTILHNEHTLQKIKIKCSYRSAHSFLKGKRR